MFFPYRGQNDRNKTKLTCTRGFRWIAGSTSNNSICRPGVAADLDPPPRIWTLPTKLSENIILNFLVKVDDTLRSSAYKSMFFNSKHAYR